MRRESLAEVRPETHARWFSTWDAARALHLTPEGVRHLVRDGKLACEWTPSHKRLFLAHQVLDLAAKRAKAQLVLVPAGSAKGARSSDAPRQISLFRVRLELVAPAKEALDFSQAKAGRSRAVLFGVR